jgi:hypothetical protein
MEEKKVLSAQEIEAQTLLELPDRKLMQATGHQNIVNQLSFILTVLKVAFGNG